MKIVKQRVMTYEEEIPSSIEEFKDWTFSSGSYIGKDFKVFARVFKKYLKSIIPKEAEIVTYHINHYFISAFIKSNEKYVYISIPDVRYGIFGGWYEGILVRTVKSVTDYTGGSSNIVKISQLKNKIKYLIKKSR